MYKYSPKTDTFYPENIIYNSLPDDVVDVGEEDFTKFIQTAPEGYTRGFSNGKVSWIKVIKSEENLASEERYWRNRELNRSDIELNKVQDSDSNAKGSVADWRSYRKALRSWPESSDFPDSTKRPVAPDATDQ